MRELWEATSGLTDVLRGSGVAARFGGNLRGEPQQNASQLPQQLRELFAGYGQLEAQPFLLSLRLGNIPGSEALAADVAGDQFRRDSVAVTRAVIGIVEWLRSRMPRYPIRFKLPYTDPLSSRVVDRGFPDADWPWLLDARQAGYQAMSTVAPQVARHLEVAETPVQEALSELRSALHSSPTWMRYVAAEAALGAEDEEALEELLDLYRGETHRVVIDAIEPDRVMRRMQHRHAAMQLTERAARTRGAAVAGYYAAFRALDRTVGYVTALLGQLLLYGPPRSIAVRHGAWRREFEGRRLEVAVATTGPWPRLNEIVELRVDLAPLAGLVIVEGFTFSLHRRGEAFVEDVRLNGAVLPGSA